MILALPLLEQQRKYDVETPISNVKIRPNKEIAVT